LRVPIEIVKTDLVGLDVLWMEDEELDTEELVGIGTTETEERELGETCPVVLDGVRDELGVCGAELTATLCEYDEDTLVLEDCAGDT
jgi:hypothetical protein